MIDHGPLLLDEIAQGAALQLFESGVQKMAADIADANKKPGAKRSFSLKFTFSPDEATLSARIDVELVGVNLAPSRPAVTSAVLSFGGQTPEILEVQQREIPLPNNVQQFNAEES